MADGPGAAARWTGGPNASGAQAAGDLRVARTPALQVREEPGGAESRELLLLLRLRAGALLGLRPAGRPLESPGQVLCESSGQPAALLRLAAPSRRARYLPLGLLLPALGRPVAPPPWTTCVRGERALRFPPRQRSSPSWVWQRAWSWAFQGKVLGRLWLRRFPVAQALWSRLSPLLSHLLGIFA